MHCYERMTKYRGVDIPIETNIAINETSNTITANRRRPVTLGLKKRVPAGRRDVKP